MSSSDTCIYSNNMTLDGTATTPDENLMTHIEVKAIEDPGTGVLVQDKIMISLDLPEEEKCDPLYYYPPSAPAAAKLSDDEDSSDSDSEDEDDEDDDLFDVVDLSPLIIRNPHHRFATKQPEQQQQQQPITATSREEYSFMEELLQTLDNIFGCSYGSCGSTAAEQMPVLKSALRRKLGEAPLTPSMKRNVSFTKLEIREFNMTLGNHPSAVTGPPVMLDATPTRESVIDLESYERARQPRRTRKQLKLSFEARRSILERDRGFTVEEVKKAWSEALQIRKQRQETRQRTPQQQLYDELYESACRKANRLLSWE